MCWHTLAFILFFLVAGLPAFPQSPDPSSASPQSSPAPAPCAANCPQTPAKPATASPASPAKPPAKPHKVYTNEDIDARLKELDELCRPLLILDTANVTWTLESFVAWAEPLVAHPDAVSALMRGVNYFCRSTTTISAGEGLAKEHRWRPQRNSVIVGGRSRAMV